MATAGGAGGSDDPTRLALGSLSADERRVLAALAVVGRATLSAEELAGVTEVADVTPVVEELRRRGLVQTDERERHSVLHTVGEQIRRTDEALSTAEQLRRNFETLARGGKLTPARLVDDAEAIVGLSGFAAETEQWASVLELVQTVEASFSVGEQVTEWIALLREGRAAAHELGDRNAEALMLDRLATASARGGDQTAARRYSQQADELRRAPVVTTPRSPGVGRIVAVVVGLLAAAAVGLGAGLLLAGNGSPAGSTTALVPVTLTLPGQTFVTVETSTLPSVTLVQTVTEVATEVVTETVVTTATVTTVPPLTTIG